MSTSVQFTKAKDPADAASWWTVWFGEALTGLLGVQVAEFVDTTPGLGTSAGRWATPGDVVAGGDLIATSAQLTPDGRGVVFQLAGGRPGRSYSIRIGVTSAPGGTYYRSVILRVAGR